MAYSAALPMMHNQIPQMQQHLEPFGDCSPNSLRDQTGTTSQIQKIVIVFDALKIFYGTSYYSQRKAQFQYSNTRHSKPINGYPPVIHPVLSTSHQDLK